MRKSRGIVRHVLAVGVLAILALAGCGDDASGSPPAYAPALKMLVFSDPHYFDPSLGTTGSAFAKYLASDRKLIAESDAIMRAMVGLVQAENPQVVLVSGDLTKDGELLSHQSAAGYLRQMKAYNRRVFVVPGNHDIENGGASSYDGDGCEPGPGDLGRAIRRHLQGPRFRRRHRARSELAQLRGRPGARAAVARARLVHLWRHARPHGHVGTVPRRHHGMDQSPVG